MESEWTQRFVWHSKGTGLLEFQPQVGVGVDWELVQTVAGPLLLVVRANGTTALGEADLKALLALQWNARLSGFDTNGYAVSVQTGTRTNPVHAAAGDDWVTLRASQAECVKPETPVAAYRFPLLNLLLDKPPVAMWEAMGTNLSIAPVADYEDVVSTLYTRDRQAVTAILSVRSPDRTAAVRTADLFCELASYACGCRVQWLHLEGVDAAETPVSAWLSSAITGPFARLPLIQSDMLWEFLESQGITYAEFRDAQPAQARRLLGIVMNAIAGDDFLELRGLKLASTVDALLTIVLPPDRPRQFVSSNRRDDFMTAVRRDIRARAAEFLPPDPPDDLGRQARWSEQIALRSNDILRPSFRELIDQLCGVLKINVEPAEISQFIRSRNELVHEARYVCQRTNHPAGWPFTEPAQEYLWMLRFVDLLVLRTLGYRGSFLDRSGRGETLVAAEPA